MTQKSVKAEVMHTNKTKLIPELPSSCIPYRVGKVNVKTALLHTMKIYTF